MARTTRSLRRAQRPKRLRKPKGVVHSTGPRELGLARDPARQEGPGPPPEGFTSGLGGNTSGTEWMVYWALWQYFNIPGDPRQPPFFGKQGYFSYQVTAIGNAGVIGSANIDFVIFRGIEQIGLRVETSRYHINTNAQQQAFDQNQITRTQKYYTIVLIFEQDFINDPSGRSVMGVVREAMEAGQSNARPAPIGSARAIRI